MAKRSSKQSRRSREQRRGPRLVTPEGDPVVMATATYTHAAWDEIHRILAEAEDFDWQEVGASAPMDSLEGAWLETPPDAAQPATLLGQRLLANLTLTRESFVVETNSRRRRRACQRRLEALLGDRISLAGIETKAMEEAVHESAPAPERDPFIPPPEMIAEIEDRMIRQWLDESIPALGGLTPREAAKTSEGRQRLMALFEYIARDQERRAMPPGMFAPDYSKAKKMLGLE